MKKSININVTERGNKYFTIYALRYMNYEGEKFTYDRYLDKKMAEESKEIVDTLDGVRCSWIIEKWVWC